jgi:hypothetical protein
MAEDVAACVRGLPKTIKIGAYDWTVVVFDEAHEELCGQSDFETSQIRLWPANLTSHNHAVGITLHECLHVIFANQGLENLKRGKDEREEQIILGFEAGLVSLFRDNPKLLTWMKKWL